MCLVQRFNTVELAPQERLRLWGEQMWSGVGGLETRTFGSELFEGEALSGRLGPVQLCRMTVGRHRLERTEALISRNDRGVLAVVFALSGSIYCRQGATQFVLQAGQWCAYDTSRPYVAATCDPAELLVVLIGRAGLNTKTFDVTGSLLKPFAADGGVSQVLLRSLLTAMQEMEAVDAAAADSLGAYLADLLRLAMVEKMAPRTVISTRDTLRARIERYIDRNLADPELSIDSIASALGCTKRYLHKVFSEKGLTLSHYIWSLRLDRCAEELGRPDRAHKAITGVAFDWGFNNSAHFSRSFKDRFGAPPRIWRATRLAAQTPAAAA